MLLHCLYPERTGDITNGLCMYKIVIFITHTISFVVITWPVPGVSAIFYSLEMFPMGQYKSLSSYETISI